jgi:hypothetical protein
MTVTTQNPARERQQFLRETTNDGLEAGVRHERLMPSLDQDFPVDQPILATIARLDATCKQCQRMMRDRQLRGG